MSQYNVSLTKMGQTSPKDLVMTKRWGAPRTRAIWGGMWPLGIWKQKWNLGSQKKLFLQVYLITC
jgi:hypothetical protein